MMRFLILIVALVAVGARAGEVTPRTVGNLAPAWTAQLPAPSRSNPVADGQSLYVTVTNGVLMRVDRETGKTIWQVDLAPQLGIQGASTGRAVLVTDKAVIFGLRNAPVIAALDKADGKVLWKTEIDPLKQAIVSQTPLAADGKIFVGVSGLNEESMATYPKYQCCAFRGSMVALDEKTGKKLWQTYTLPEGYAGGSIWSSSPLFDSKRHTLFATTGNAFRAPDDAMACLQAHDGKPAEQRTCFAKDAWFDSILALDPETGRIKWGFRAEDADVFTGACLIKIGGVCGGGGDFDFGNGALEWSAGGHTLVGAGAKSGTFWALDPKVGKLVWKTTVGPGGPNGGIEFGSAVGDGRVYVAEGNVKQIAHDPGAYTLPSGKTINYGSYAALDAATGRTLWQVPDPAGEPNPDNGQPCTAKSPHENCVGAFAKGALTTVNGIVFGCSTAPKGPLYAFDGATGAKLWEYDAGVSCDTRATVVGDRVYWVVGAKLYAFSTDAPKAAVADATVATGRSIRDGIYAAAQAEVGKAIYVKTCAAGCHQENLSGAGPAPSLAGADFRGRWDGIPVAELFKRIRTTMPKSNPGSLSDDDTAALVAYLLSANGYPAGKDALSVEGIGGVAIVK
jgi:polyvinyl alcohol dehydrogenase (cytochrome)